MSASIETEHWRLEPGRYKVTVVGILKKESPSGLFHVAQLKVQESTNPSLVSGDLAHFVWREGGFVDFSDLYDYVGTDIYVEAKEVTGKCSKKVFLVPSFYTIPPW